MIEEKKKKNKGTIVVIIILILIILGLGGYIVYDKVLKEEPVKVEEPKEEVVEQQEELVIGNTFKLDNITCEKDETSNCIKKVKVAYNNENYEVKLKLMEKETETQETRSVYFELYVDDKLINTIDSGFYFYDDGPIDEYQGSVYVVDSKYLAVLTPEYTTISSGYVLTFYNNDKQVSNKINVIYGGQSLCKDENCTEIINDLEDLEFDGTTFKYWGQDCNLMENVKYQVTFDGTNVNKTVSEKAGNTYGAGASC